MSGSNKQIPIFNPGDFYWVGTYDDAHLPDPEDTERVDRDWSNFIQKLYRWCDKNGVKRPEWAVITEYSTQPENGTMAGRHHHHAFIQRTEGLTNDILGSLWRDENGKGMGHSIFNYINAANYNPEIIVKFINKDRSRPKKVRVCATRGKDNEILPGIGQRKVLPPH